MINLKVMFGSWKILKKKLLMKIIFSCLVYHGKYKRKSNIIKIS